ncbi:Ankyrin repeat-containing protein [Brazilian cedratvirus IHUMI]|uniref:Ankyrin repeat-containing protein n=1 Tax=Brazilian cedratvirus IHUMI TaxID=2126980 RepID=A0A2R8FDJ8_9VIRU|nr:Ankyrin repeat-containing protein [Brazilian cedratvirus IHUMI]
MLNLEVVSCIFSFTGTFVARKVCREFRYGLRAIHGEDYMKLCFAQGNLEQIRRFNPPLLQRFAGQALLNFQSKVLDYLVERGYEWREADLLYLCSVSGLTEQRLEFIQRIGLKPGCLPLCRSLLNHHLEIYLFYKDGQDKKLDLDLLSQMGHLELVKEIYLSCIEEEKDRFSSFIEAGAARGQKGKEILSWLYSVRGRLGHAHREYALLGNHEMFIWCVERGAELDQDCLISALCGENNLETVRYILERNPRLIVEEHMSILVETDSVQVLDYLHSKGYRVPADALSSISVKVLRWMESREYKLDKSMFVDPFFMEIEPVQTLQWLLKRELISLQPSLYDDAFITDSREYFLYLVEKKVPLLQVNLFFLSAVTNEETFREALSMTDDMTQIEEGFSALVDREHTLFLDMLLSDKLSEWKSMVYKMACERKSLDLAYWMRRKGYAGV